MIHQCGKFNYYDKDNCLLSVGDAISMTKQIKNNTKKFSHQLLIVQNDIISRYLFKLFKSSMLKYMSCDYVIY